MPLKQNAMENINIIKHGKSIIDEKLFAKMFPKLFNTLVYCTYA